MTTQLVSLTQARTHLRITDDRQDTDITMKIQQASAIVMQFKKLNAVPAEWMTGSPLTIDAPQAIQAATLLVMSELFFNREASISTVLTETVKTMIDREPTLA